MSKNHTVRLPRWRKLASYSRQFTTFRFCFGIWWRRSWFSLNGKMGIRRSEKGRSSYVDPARSATGLNGEIKRRTDVVGIFPSEPAITRLIGAILLEQSDEWATQRARYMTLETIGSVSDNPTVSLPAVAA